MKNETRRRGMAAALDMPLELERGIVKVTMIGDVSVLVENHGGIRAFSPHRVAVNVGDGVLVIRGEGMCLKLLKKDEVEAEGRIFGVDFEKGGAR
ncbi:MAG: sporulation protein YqfC [Firmicutes bacterium]|nr:sporulation protein YqfC [Bacillota bacterium]